MTGDGPLPTVRLDRCLACGGTSLRHLAMRYEFRGSFPAVACRVCGMRFLAVQPSPEGLEQLYAPEYFERDFRCGRSETSYYDEKAFVEENRGLLDAFDTLGPRGRLLEVGCAGGWLLKHAADRGWEVAGVEVSEQAARHARGLGLAVFQGELPDAPLQSDHFDLVYMGDVLEHVPDCRGALEVVARVLKRGGHLYLRGPITTNSLARRLGLGIYGAMGKAIVLREPPYHLWEFTPGPLVRLAKAVGLTPISVRQSKIPPGHAHGAKSIVQRAAMAVLDAVNLPLTLALNVLGDRVVLVARKD